MYNEIITLETAKLAMEKGFAVEPPCTCGGFPDCICEESRRMASSSFPDVKYYRCTQTILQRWIREASGIEAYVNPVQVVMANKTFFMYEAKVKEIREQIFLTDNKTVEQKYEKYETALETALFKALTLMNTMEVTIDLNRYKLNGTSTTGRVFSGREFGALVRSETGIDRLARLGIKATIQLPDDTFTVNPSFLEEFLQGAFDLLGPEALQKQFTFSCKSEFRINDNLEHSLWRLEEKRRKKMA